MPRTRFRSFYCAQSPTSESPAQSYLSALERGEKEPGAAVLLAISKEFGKSVDWLLTGKAFVEPKKRVTKDPTEL